MDYIVNHTSMVSGQAEAVTKRYHKYVGKSGRTWLVSDTADPGGDVYVTNNAANTTSRSQGFEGFGGATLKMPLVDGGVFELHGGWHSNSEALYADTGVDVRDKHTTFVVLSKERGITDDKTYRTVMRDVVYKDDSPMIGAFDRYNELAKFYPEANWYYSESKGGSSCGPIRRAKPKTGLPSDLEVTNLQQQIIEG